MRALLVKRGGTFTEAKDEAAFYGPKIDVQMKNANGKEDTAFTVQYDFCMPGRFNLVYTNEAGKEEIARVVHRSSVGAIERIIAFLIEKYMGAFPLWLAPVQVNIIPIDEPHHAEAKKVYSALREANIRCELIEGNGGFGKKVRATKLEKVPYFIIIGDKDIEAKKVTLESRDKGNLGQMTTEEIVAKLLKEIKEKK